MASPLDKAATRARQRRERAEAEREVAALEPPFPFSALEFNSDFFDIGANPPDDFRPVEVSEGN